MQQFVVILLMSLFLLSSSSVTAEEAGNKLVIHTISSSEGTVVVEGQPHFEKTFEIVIYNSGIKPIELSGFSGCYRAADKKGREFDDFTVQVDLLGTLKQEVKKGSVSFISEDNSVYDTKFVKWSSKCANFANQLKLRKVARFLLK